MLFYFRIRLPDLPLSLLMSNKVSLFIGLFLVLLSIGCRDDCRIEDYEFRTPLPVTSPIYPTDPVTLGNLPMQQSLPELMFTNAENETLVRIDCNNSFLNIPSEWQIDMEVSGDCPAAGDYFEDYARPAGGLMGGTRITCNPNGNGGRDRRLMDFVAVNQEQLLYCADPPIAIDANMPPYRVSIFVKTPIWNQNGRNYFFDLGLLKYFP